MVLTHAMVPLTGVGFHEVGDIVVFDKLLESDMGATNLWHEYVTYRRERSASPGERTLCGLLVAVINVRTCIWILERAASSISSILRAHHTT